MRNVSSLQNTAPFGLTQVLGLQSITIRNMFSKTMQYGMR